MKGGIGSRVRWGLGIRSVQILPSNGAEAGKNSAYENDYVFGGGGGAGSDGYRNFRVSSEWARDSIGVGESMLFGGGCGDLGGGDGVV